jgi:hypothetical protein
VPFPYMLAVYLVRFIPPCFFFETGHHYIVRTGLELKVLLPLTPKCRDYTVSHHAQLFYNFFSFLFIYLFILVGLGFELRTLCSQSRHFTV